MFQQNFKAQRAEAEEANGATTNCRHMLPHGHIYRIKTKPLIAHNSVAHTLL